MGTGLVLGFIWVIPNMGRIPLEGQGAVLSRLTMEIVGLLLCLINLLDKPP